MHTSIGIPRDPEATLTMAELHLASEIESQSGGALEVRIVQAEQGTPCFWFSLTEPEDVRYTMPSELAKEAIGFLRMTKSRIEFAIERLRHVPECLAELEAIEHAREVQQKRRSKRRANRRA